MTSISNMKIGKKITLVLGGIILLLAGLSGLSLWGTHANEALAVTLVQRLTKARLAGAVEGDTSAITMNLARMILSGKRDSETVQHIARASQDTQRGVGTIQDAGGHPDQH